MDDYARQMYEMNQHDKYRLQEIKRRMEEDERAGQLRSGSYYADLF
jgi:hypothetical protein